MATFCGSRICTKKELFKRMNDETTIVDIQLWSLQEQIYYGVSWTLFLLGLYYIFKYAK